MAPLLQVLLLLVLSAVVWREADGNVWQMAVDHHVAVVRVVAAALVKVHTKWVLQNNVHCMIIDHLLGQLNLHSIILPVVQQFSTLPLDYQVPVFNAM